MLTVKTDKSEDCVEWFAIPSTGKQWKTEVFENDGVTTSGLLSFTCGQRKRMKIDRCKRKRFCKRFIKDPYVFNENEQKRVLGLGQHYITLSSKSRDFFVVDSGTDDVERRVDL